MGGACCAGESRQLPGKRRHDGMSVRMFGMFDGAHEGVLPFGGSAAGGALRTRMTTARFGACDPPEGRDAAVVS